MLTRRFPLALCLFLAACFNPDLSMVTFTCTAAEPLCPDGQSCSDGGTCQSITPPADLAKQPIPPDLSEAVPPCTDVSIAGQPGSAFACRTLVGAGFLDGNFRTATMLAQQLKGSAYAPCANANKINLTSLASVKGFFISASVGSSFGGGMCGTCNTGNDCRFFGGGSSAGIKNVVSATPCGGFGAYTWAPASGRTWTFNNSSVDQASNYDPLEGLLICR